ncbi:hypothetical protein FF011L_40940 [Roseimaritima multifibrata]|uniref:PSP1 C-terminal domain-containing protein n=1 Tax=Roseimaritima multifibrata TaxID=1930274 RepID=A0A517MK79_9BACT|nr:hypothetical protein FF011L_40940 [Roseimaritima multifibrata]
MSVADEPEGTVVRRTTPEDELLIDRLEKYRIRAVVRCQQLLAESNTETTLLEVDPLFDGKTLIFFFLGPIDDTVQELSDRLTSEYEKKVHSKHFAKLLAEGCGPGCGSKEGSGCSGGCAVCVAATACQS